MRRLLPVLFLFACQSAFGQKASLSTFISWFSKSDKASIQSYFEGSSYRLFEEKDSLDFHQLHYSLVKTEQGVQLHSYLLLNDSLPELISFETCSPTEQQGVFAQLKAARFKLLSTDINGNFITSTYDNGIFLIHEDYQAIDNPLGKGEITYFRYRIIRKNGNLDTMNGEKTVLISENGASHIGIRENYRNGVLEGERIFYFPDGTVKRKENYRAGRLNGLVSDFNEDGKLTHTSTHSYHWKYGMEKWYNKEGKTVRSIQWQRDLPVGIQKQTFNGTIVESIPYVKGIKQGLAKVPIYYDPEISANYPLDTLNDEPFALETVNFENGLKAGKAVCIYFNQSDTMYVGYYKAGKLDSIYTRYGQENILYTSNYTAGLENGARIYRIPSGPLKDTVYRIENYVNGKLDGKVTEYYQKEQDQLFQDPDRGFHIAGSSSGTTNIPGNWKKIYREGTYQNGIRNGQFYYQYDSLNHTTEYYVNGKQEGKQESELIVGGKQVKTTQYYKNGLRTNEWTTDYISDSVVVTENYTDDEKQGTETRVVKGKLVEKRHFFKGVLTEVRYFLDGDNYDFFSSDEFESPDSVIVAHGKKSGDTTTLFSYSFSRKDFPGKDTALVLMANKIQTDPDKNRAPYGLFQIITPDFSVAGMLKNGKTDGKTAIMHRKMEIMEHAIYKDDSIIESEYRVYKSYKDAGAYTGVFISDYSNERISVKDGLRHGWCIAYDPTKKEVKRTKYVKGIARKTVVK